MKKCLILMLSLVSISIFSKVRIAVLDFSAKRVEKDFAEAIVENLITALIDSDAFELIERSQLQKLMNELSLQNSDDFNDKLREDLGNLYGAEMVILGSITKIGNQITANVRGVEVKTGVAKFAKSFTTSSENEIPELIKDLVSVIIGKKNTTFVKEEKKRKATKYENEYSKTESYDNKFFAPYIAMKVNSYIWIPISAITLPVAFLCWGLQFYFIKMNDNPILAIRDLSYEQLNKYADNAIALKKVRNAMFVLGGLSLPLGIITGALSSYFKKKYKRTASLHNKIISNKRIALNFDIGFTENDFKFEAIMSF